MICFADEHKGRVGVETMIGVLRGGGAGLGSEPGELPRQRPTESLRVHCDALDDALARRDLATGRRLGVVLAAASRAAALSQPGRRGSL